MKIDIIIRVFNRIKDLDICLKIIKDTWLTNNYRILVSSNGKKTGFSLSKFVAETADVLFESENTGHLTGSSSLLLNAIPFIDVESNYTIILEADTWIYTDKIINKYIQKLEQEKAVWASAKWYDRFYSLATDFAVIRTDYLRKNPKIFNFSVYPECHVAQYIINSKSKYIHISENMPVMVPGYFKKYPFAPNGRFFVFPKSQMVTHHVEVCKNGFETKKRHFNLVSKTQYFSDVNNKYKMINCLLIRFTQFIVIFFPKKSWIKRQEFLNINK